MGLSLRPLLKNTYTDALVLGDGGAAQAVKCVLQNLDINYRVVYPQTAWRKFIV
ncbi:hypothetical protein HK413_08910 [Mucilaginibacter sp. S1162]|uniref:Uncharacterized protein n=1 Tax=Mucilaginibacter humi TaxID=2732510 RepID=A0ABX1W2P4_9SPHI|nr:hypothetical protein [Mucilaginibacter humi]NNU34238.1 hypothetical protein [Mucilaginibacter humi]